MPAPDFAFRMLRRREVVLPTWRGWLVVLVSALVSARAFLGWVQPFLSLNAPARGEILVVEGWIPDYALRQALDAFRAHRYPLLVTTGGPLPQGMAYSYQGTYARLAAASLEAFGLPADSIAEVPSPEVDKDRTYAEGVALGAWMRARGARYRAIDLWSFSTHARRSRLVYRMALGDSVKVGVYAPPDLQYDPERWWKTSNGVRRVTDEWIAYLYAKLIFRG